MPLRLASYAITLEQSPRRGCAVRWSRGQVALPAGDWQFAGQVLEQGVGDTQVAFEFSKSIAVNFWQSMFYKRLLAMLPEVAQGERFLMVSYQRKKQRRHCYSAVLQC